MKVGMNQENELKEKSIALDIPFPNLLHGFVLEEIVRLVANSDYRDSLWLANSQILGLNAYKKGRVVPLEYYYVENPELPEDSFGVGARLSWKMASLMIAMIFRKEASEYITWMGRAVQEEEVFQWNLIGQFMDMEIPVSVRLIPFRGNKDGQNEKPEIKSLIPFMGQGEEISYNHYAAECLLTKSFMEIMTKLELVNSMEAFEIVDRILLEQQINGRRFMELLNEALEADPRVKKIKRYEQLASYCNYTYMRKRWESYCKAKNYENRSWENVMKLLLAFAEPIWTSICEEKVFFDDWMPEIGRFLM